jgi:glycosyltransferase involved in cell wall biosynthesis
LRKGLNSSLQEYENNLVQRPRILYVTSHCPSGPAYGARIRAFNIGKLLQRIGDVSLLLVTSDLFPDEDIEQAKQHFRLQAIIPIKVTSQTIKDRLRRELDPTFFGINNQTVSDEDRNRILRFWQEHDLIWFQTVKLPDLFRVFRWEKSILDVDDFQSQLYATRARIAPSMLRRFLDLRMMQLWRRRERLFLKRFSVLCVCSNGDQNFIDNKERTYVVRNGYDIPDAACKKRLIDLARPRLGFIGLLDYKPNWQGISWFIKSVWPIVKKSIPDARLRLVGKYSGGELSSHGTDIDYLGWVADVGSEIDSWSAMIVPIQQGSGTRIKIAEGLARRCPVISTSLGAYGYDMINEREAILVDHPSDFAKACIDVINSASIRESLAEYAYQKYSNYWTWEAQADAVTAAVFHCLNR